VLFDVFPDGSRVLGGAPFNVAWHLQAFGLEPLMITRVGDDAGGEGILDAMHAWGINSRGVQVDPAAHTGKVRVDFDSGAPNFTILPDQAYDKLDSDAALDTMSGEDLSLVYHGTLIARDEVARATLGAVREQSQLPTFVDVNLRDPWWGKSGVTSLLNGARWVKLNDDELARLTGAGATDSPHDLGSSAADFARRHNLNQVVVTRGDQGALVWTEEGYLTGRPPVIRAIIDTVGAGDAFAAVWIAGLICGWAPRQTLQRALKFAASLCTVRGATVTNRDLYEQHLEMWEDQ
jgi:fructokinase